MICIRALTSRYMPDHQFNHHNGEILPARFFMKSNQAEKLSNEFKIKGMATSIATEEQAKNLGIELVEIDKLIKHDKNI